MNPSLPHLVLDLDGTLFNKHRTTTFAQLDKNATALVASLMRVDAGEANRLMRGFQQQHGSTIQGLLRAGVDFCAETFIRRLHEVDLTDMDENPMLRAALSALPHNVYVYTNGCHHYATRVLHRLGIHDLIDGIFDIRMANFVSKPNQVSFEAFLGHFDLAAADCLFVDDSKSNLATGKRLGMTTVYVHEPDETGFEQFIDHATADIATLLQTLRPAAPTLA